MHRHQLPIIGFAVMACLQLGSCMSIECMQSYVLDPRKPCSDVKWGKQVGKGTVFGTLGSNDQGLYGKGGYKQDIFNDARGKLEGQAHGTRVLGPNGDTSSFGGKLDWNNVNKDARATIELTKQIHGPTNLDASASKVWNFDKNTRLSAGGTVTQELGHGKPDYGVGATFQHDW
ncbi:unnamed protein product [Parnassius mnemosyne]|uniref:Gloverin n=1 Tax=Parnassius mnemosyne TaxID=213953 RepID=A0AAV1L3L8_9NEOP